MRSLWPYFVFGFLVASLLPTADGAKSGGRANTSHSSGSSHADSSSVGTTLRDGEVPTLSGTALAPRADFTHVDVRAADPIDSNQLASFVKGRVPVFFFLPEGDGYRSTFGGEYSANEQAITERTQWRLASVPEVTFSRRGSKEDLVEFARKHAQPRSGNGALAGPPSSTGLPEAQPSAKRPFILVLHNVGSSNAPVFEFADGRLTLSELRRSLPEDSDPMIVSCHSPDFAKHLSRPVTADQAARILCRAINDVRLDGSSGDLRAALNRAALAELTADTQKAVRRALTTTGGTATIIFALAEGGMKGGATSRTLISRTYAITIEKNVPPNWIWLLVVGGLNASAGIVWFGRGRHSAKRLTVSSITVVLGIVLAWWFAYRLRLIRTESLFECVIGFVGILPIAAGLTALASMVSAALTTTIFNSSGDEKDWRELWAAHAIMWLFPVQWIAFNSALCLGWFIIPQIIGFFVFLGALLAVVDLIPTGRGEREGKSEIPPAK